MLLGTARITIALFFMIAAYFLGDALWALSSNDKAASVIWHENLLSALWKVGAIILAITAIGYQLKSQLTEVSENEFLTTDESNKLNRTINTRRNRITFYLFFGVFTAFYLVMSLIMIEFPHLSFWYFKSVLVVTSLQVILFVYILLTISEIEKFKTRLNTRKRKQSDKERLLKQLSEI